MEGNMNLTLKVWRQKNQKDTGKFVPYSVKGISVQSINTHQLT